MRCSKAFVESFEVRGSFRGGSAPESPTGRFADNRPLGAPSEFRSVRTDRREVAPPPIALPPALLLNCAGPHHRRIRKSRCQGESGEFARACGPPDGMKIALRPRRCRAGPWVGLAGASPRPYKPRARFSGESCIATTGLASFAPPANRGLEFLLVSQPAANPEPAKCHRVRSTSR